MNNNKTFRYLKEVRLAIMNREYTIEDRSCKTYYTVHFDDCCIEPFHVGDYIPEFNLVTYINELLSVAVDSFEEGMNHKTNEIKTVLVLGEDNE